MDTLRQQAVFEVDQLENIKRQLLDWADTFDVAVYLDSNEFPQSSHSTWECLVAVGAVDRIQANAGDAFTRLGLFQAEKRDWLFGFFGYDLKDEVEKLPPPATLHTDGIGLPDLYFFQPEIVAGIRSAECGVRNAEYGVRRTLEIFSLTHSPNDIYESIRDRALRTPHSALRTPHSAFRTPHSIQPRIPEPDYLNTVETIRQHIIEGDVYELNLCQEFFAEGVQIEPKAIFERLNELTKAPFAAYLRYHDRHLMCASPERFLRKTGDLLVSQPIKGTRRRHPDPAEDKRLLEHLGESEKDRAENVMIVDLVRNDLARYCRPGSVRVEELFGLYTFKTVHQMISTVSGQLRPEAHPLDALRAAFPMGSMTGAPKVMAMTLIGQYERTRRGLFSGALGYFTPEGDFDFNVVIRSILYNRQSGYLSCQVGGAIVYDSVPEQEYEECLVKAGALMQALGMGT